MRFTPEAIKSLGQNEVFVFGSNEAGIHGAGAARLAMDKWNAPFGMGFGFAPSKNKNVGGTFAIPTKDWQIYTLPTEVIGFYIKRFLDFAKIHPEMTFLVTKIGCGLAGLLVDDIAPLFHKHKLPPNVVLPEEFWNPNYLV